MKCPRCGAWTEVAETRALDPLTTRRRRQCGNGHRFSTLEVLPPAVHSRDLAATIRAAAAAASRWARDRLIRKDPRPASDIAREHRITEARVRQIRRQETTT